jgi:hypothetical protein
MPLLTEFQMNAVHKLGLKGSHQLNFGGGGGAVMQNALQMATLIRSNQLDLPQSAAIPARDNSITNSLFFSPTLLDLA